VSGQVQLWLMLLPFLLMTVLFANVNEPKVACPWSIHQSIFVMEQHTLRNVNNYFNTIIYSYLDTSGGQSSSLHLNVVLLFNPNAN